MLLLADWVIPVSSAPLADAGVRVVEGRIAEVGPAAELRARYEGRRESGRSPAARSCPASSTAHTHLELSAFRGFARPSGFGRWMLRLLLARRKLDPADYRGLGAVGRLRVPRAAASPHSPTPPTTAWRWRAQPRAAGLRARVYQEVFGLDDAALPAHHGALRGSRWPAADEIATAPRDRRAPAGGGRGLAPRPLHGLGPPLPGGGALRAPRRPPPGHPRGRVAGRGGTAGARHRRDRPGLPGRAAVDRRRLEAARGCARSPTSAAPGALGPETLVIHAVQVDDEEVGHPRRERGRGGSLPALQRSSALRRGAGGRAARGRGHRRTGHRQPGLQRLPGHVRRDAGGAGRRAGNGRAAAAGSPSRVTAEQVLRMATLEGARALGWGGADRQPRAGQERGRHRRARCRAPAGRPHCRAVPAFARAVGLRLPTCA